MTTTVDAPSPHDPAEKFTLTAEYALRLNEVTFLSDNSVALPWFAPDCRCYLPGRPVMDRHAFLDTVTMVMNAKPDVVLDLKDIFVDGNTAVVHATFTGHQTGPLLGIPPTGRKVSITELGTVTFDDAGRVVEFRQEADYLGMLTQLGVVPPLGTGPLGQLAHSVRGAVRLYRLDRKHRKATGR
ncbi:ester cyclase [Saccharothrix sp. NRRL B-16314]|uniref:ester cyclase n=1 Tax=Saccharothrix sp. NRRL B-16314 TaxID=1463825 RepID=UPI000690604E|nr:ester cyclase [Saccharothrix sp. NRRL B-16314]